MEWNVSSRNMASTAKREYSEPVKVFVLRAKVSDKFMEVVFWILYYDDASLFTFHKLFINFFTISLVLEM
jgi:hypothetical protein